MLRVMVLLLALGGAMVLPAAAFEQTNDVPKTTEPGVVPSVPDIAGLELTVPEAAPLEESGPTISLPGLGTIGTLPKFDFGLELLYGEDESSAAVEDDALENDLRIRGSVKHKF